jgi:flagellar hook-length control protein FliK
MQQDIEALRATVELASKEGSAQARISLEPEELGSVRIHITQTAAGLIARVSAGSVAGTQAIAAGEGDLRSTLSSLGVSLLRLDIGSFASNGRQGAQQPESGARRVAPLREVEEPSIACAGGEEAHARMPAYLGSIDVLA